MATNSKLEFYKFKLNPQAANEFKTFKDYAIDELGGDEDITHEDAFKLCFKHFIHSLNEDIAKDERLKKKLTLINDKKVNKYLAHKPKIVVGENVFHGVLNGGPYGRDRIISDNGNPNDNTVLGHNKSVLLYFYIFVYLPTDHNEGCFIIHSNSSEETITVLFRSYIRKLFKGQKYKTAITEAFCPKSFQDEFRDGAVLKSMTFKSTFIENTHATDTISQLLQQYDIKIEAIPKDKNISVNYANQVKDFFANKIFGTKNNEKKLERFNQTKLHTQNEVTKGTKVFEWNTRDNDFIPVVYLKGRCDKTNPDGTPDFNDLAEYCQNIFNEEILLELRPDLDVVKVK